MDRQKKGYAIGIDVGGSSMKYGIVSSKGNVICHNIMPTRPSTGHSDFLDQLLKPIEELIRLASEMGITLNGIGLGVPAIVDDGTIMAAANLTEINGVNVAGQLSPLFGMPVYVENDANLMGFAEFRFGHAQDLSDAVFLTVGSGIGGSVMTGKRLFGGFRNRGTELGHLSIDWQGASCSCGGRGCLEALASVEALIASYTQIRISAGLSPIPDCDGRTITSRYLAAEPEAMLVMESHFDYLASGVSSIINIFSPQKVIIGGGITDSGEYYVEAIRSRVLKRVMKETSEFCTIDRALLGNKAGFMGAAALVLANTL